MNLIDNISSIRSNAAVVLVRESGRDVSIAETVDVHRCPMGSNAGQLVDFRELFHASKPTANLRLRDTRQVQL